MLKLLRKLFKKLLKKKGNLQEENKNNGFRRL